MHQFFHGLLFDNTNFSLFVLSVKANAREGAKKAHSACGQCACVDFMSVFSRGCVCIYLSLGIYRSMFCYSACGQCACRLHVSSQYRVHLHLPRFRNFRYHVLLFGVLYNVHVHGHASAFK